MSQARRPAGTPTGGEFAPQHHSEADLGVDLYGNIATHDLRIRRRLAERRFDDLLGPDDLSAIMEADRDVFPEDVELPAHRLAAFISRHPSDVVDPAEVVAFACTDDGGDFDQEVARASDEELRTEAEESLADDAGIGSWATKVTVANRRLSLVAAGTLDDLDVSAYDYPDRTIGPSVDLEGLDDRILDARRADPGRMIRMGHTRSGSDGAKAQVAVVLTESEGERVAEALSSRSPGITQREAKVLVGRWIDSPLSDAGVDEATHDRVSRAVAEALPDTAGRTLAVAREVRERIEDDFEGLSMFTSGDGKAQAYFESVAIPYDYFHARKG